MQEPSSWNTIHVLSFSQSLNQAPPLLPTYDRRHPAFTSQCWVHFCNGHNFRLQVTYLTLKSAGKILSLLSLCALSRCSFPISKYRKPLPKSNVLSVGSSSWISLASASWLTKNVLNQNWNNILSCKKRANIKYNKYSVYTALHFEWTS